MAHSSDPLALAQGAAQAVVPLAVLGAAVAGSLHCVSMCGGLVLAAAPTKRTALFYQLGRLAGYASLGAIAGLLGEKVLRSTVSGLISWAAALSIGAAFIALGLGVLRGGSAHVRLPKQLLGAYSKIWNSVMGLKPESSMRSGAIGLLSVFLPCGWLYGFVLGATATQSAVRGALFLFLFWLGTLPALTLAPAVIRKVLSPLASRVPKIAGSALILAGLFTIALKLTPLLAAKGPERTSSSECPMHHGQR